MPGYIEKWLHYLSHEHPKRLVHAPHEWTRPIFDRHVQYSTPDDTFSRLSDTDTKLIQSIISTLLYYARAVYPSIYPALNEVSLTQVAPTKSTLKKCHQLLDYVS